MATPDHRLLHYVSLLAVFFSLIYSLPLSAQETSILLRPARVFTAEGEKNLSDCQVLIKVDKIAAAGPPGSFTVPAGTRVLDLPGMTLLPGLIEGHAHIFLHPYNETRWDDQMLKEPLPYQTLKAVREQIGHGAD